MLTLIVVGVILLVIGYLAALPHPTLLILRILGWISVIIGAIYLLVPLINGQHASY